MTVEDLKKAHEISASLEALNALDKFMRYYDDFSYAEIHLSKLNFENEKITLPTWLAIDCIKLIAPKINAKIKELEDEFTNL